MSIRHLFTIFLAPLFDVRLNLNYVPGTPSTLSDMSAPQIRRIAYDKRLREDSIRPSVFEMLKSAVKVSDDGKTVNVVKAGIFMEIDVPPTDGQSCIVALAKPLDKAPQYGTSNHVLGNEDESSLLYTTLYYNEIKKGVKYKAWGYDFNDTEYLKWVDQYGERITTFMAENRDTRIHQALTLTYGEELINEPLNLTRQFNKNWIIPNLDPSSYPAYDKDAPTRTDGAADAYGYYASRVYSGSTTFAENIAEALITASGTGSASKALLTVSSLLQIINYAENTLLLEKVMLDGQPSYIFLVASNVKGWALNPAKSGSWGNYFQNVATYMDPKRTAFPGELGRFGCLVFVENHRAPTLKITGSNGSYSLAVGFLNPGNRDYRNTSAWANTSGSTNYVFDLCYLLGANALAEYVPDPLKTGLKAETEYGQIQGRAAYLGSGIMIPAFDKDTASRLDGSSTTQIQKGSAIVPVSRAPIETIS